MSIDGADTVSGRTKSRAIEALRGLVTRDQLAVSAFERAVAAILQAENEGEFVAVIASLPSPVAITPFTRRLTEPLKIRGGFGRLRLAGCWQLARQTNVRAELGSVILNLTEAEFDDRIVDLRIYTGWGTIGLVVPPGLGVQVLHSHGTLVSAIDPPIPGFPLVRLRATTNVGRVRLARLDDLKDSRLPRLLRRERRELGR